MDTEQHVGDMPSVAGVEHTTVDLDGVPLHVAQAGDGDPVVLLHGFPQHWWAWRDVLPRLAARHRVICPDLRGFGWSAAPGGRYDLATATRDLVGILDRLGVARAHLVSHDVGSLIGFGLCRDQPRRVRRHVAIATPPPFIRFSPRLIPAMPHLWFQQVLAAPGLGAWAVRTGHGRLPRHLLRAFSARPDAMTATAVDVYVAQFDDRARARAASALYRQLIMPEFMRILGGAYRRSRISTSTLALFGAADTAFPPALVRHLVRDADRYADHLELRFVDGGSHFLVDDRPDAVTNEVLAFLR